MSNSNKTFGNNTDYIQISPLIIKDFTIVSIRQFRSSPLTIWVFDSQENKVSVIFDGWLTKGNHNIQWFAEGFCGKRLKTGEYVVAAERYDQRIDYYITIK